MSLNVIYTEQSQRDLTEIFDYIALSLLESDNAKKQTKRIMDAIESLDEMPLRHRVYDKEPWKSRGLRVMNVDSYLVFYIPVIASGIVAIVRIMHCGRNLQEQL